MAAQIQEDMRLSVSRSPDGAYYVRIGGDFDLSDSRALGNAARELIAADARVIYVDLAEVTLMGSVVGFLVQVAGAKRPASPLVLCRASASARQVIGSTGLAQRVGLRVDLPHPWPPPHTDRREDTAEIIAQRGSS